MTSERIQARVGRGMDRDVLSTELVECPLAEGRGDGRVIVQETFDQTQVVGASVNLEPTERIELRSRSENRRSDPRPGWKRFGFRRHHGPREPLLLGRERSEPCVS